MSQSERDAGTPRQTPLYSEHVRLGANLTDFAGWAIPLRYSSELAEHHAVRRTGGLFDLSHMGEIEVTGPQAANLLDYALVSAVGGLADGRAKYTMICADDGGILDDLIVYRLADQRFLVVANASNAEVVLRELSARSAGFDAEVHDTRDDWALIALQGPVAARVLGTLTDADLPGLRYYRILTTSVAGHPARLARTGYTGEDGFEIFCSPADASAIWNALLTAGEAAGVIPCGLASRDSLRLEAGMPLYGHELSRDVTPYEANLARVAGERETEFVGKAALAQRAAEGPRRLLVGLTPAGRRAARAGYPVLDTDGAEVGVVTSGAPSPTLGHPIAMAYVPPQLASVGTALQVSIRGALVGAEVVSLPFYKRPPAAS